MSDLVHGYRELPESLSWAGGQAGGIEQLLVWRIAEAVGVNPSRVTYVPFAGSGEMMPAVLGNQVSVGIAFAAAVKSYADTRSVRVLAVSGATRSPSLDVPTLAEQGIDVEVENWRALFAPPGITGTERARLVSALTILAHSAEWQQVLERSQWTNRFIAGPSLAQFLSAEEVRVRELVRRLGTTQEGGRRPVRTQLSCS